MKKWFMILCSLILALSLSGCAMSADDQEIAEQKQSILNYKLETVKDNSSFFVSLIDYLETTQYPVMANYNNEEVEASAEIIDTGE